MSSRTAVGIVIDTNVLQAVELAAEGERLVLRQAVCEPLPEDAFVDGELANAGAVAETVRRLFRSRGLGRRNVSVALGGRSAIARIIEVSETSEAEAEQTLQPGDVIEILMPGGGGYGPPAERDPALRARDRLEGYVTG